jgi:hypothetical protein
MISSSKDKLLNYGIIIVVISMIVLFVSGIMSPPPSLQPNRETGQVVQVHVHTGIRYITEKQNKRRYITAWGEGILLLLLALLLNEKRDDKQDPSAS